LANLLSRKGFCTDQVPAQLVEVMELVRAEC
jgi:hypothetical protein